MEITKENICVELQHILNEELHRIDSMALFWSFKKIRASYTEALNAYKHGKMKYSNALGAKRNAYKEAFGALPCNVTATPTNELEDEKVVLSNIGNGKFLERRDGKAVSLAVGYVVDTAGKSDEEATKEIWRLATLLSYHALTSYEAVVVTTVL